MLTLLLPKIGAFIKAHWKYAVALALIVLAFASGRFATPAKVVTHTETKVVVQTVTKTVTVQAKSEEKAQVISHDRTRIVYKDHTVYRDVTKTADEVKDSSVVAESHSEVHTRAETKVASKTVDNKKPDWHVSALVGLSATDAVKGKLTPEYGAVAERRIAGPLFGGVWALGSQSSVSAGVAVGLSF